MAEQLRVMISSTARDLPEHRKEVMDACLRQGMFPIMMEHLPASDDEAISASLKMVDDADIYLLILAHRYGYVPKANNPTEISVTEHEYNRAVKRKLPILTFVMHEDHPVKAADVEKGEGAVKLEAFKNRALLKVTNFFKSPADLRANVIDSLSDRRQKDLTAFHYVSDIPTPPEVYIAHPYTFLQTHTLIGRQAELKLLTDWITGKELEADGYKAPANSVRIMSVLAIGGMGKSALTWKWFNDVAPQEMKNLAGRMWWSFYESDATFENFVTRALAYVTKRPLDEIQQIWAPERETQLLAALDHKPFLFTLDGLERILVAYARMDASRLDDNEVGKDKILRKTSDPRVGNFLKKLAQIKNSRILVSTRLYPAELETAGGDQIPGNFKLDIKGLTDTDAVELWRAFRVSGSRDELIPIFNTFAKHTLLIQALAGEVKRYRKAPGNFQEWRKANPHFDPAKFPDLTKAMGHVLEFPLRGLDDRALRVLHVIAAFRMPATYDTLTALLVGKAQTHFELSTGQLVPEEGKLFDEETDLDETLTELEDRGLLGWDKRANRYDLHPIVRGVAWSSLPEFARHSVYTALQSHFDAIPQIDEDKIGCLEDLSPAIELFNSMIGLERYDDASNLFIERIDKYMLQRFVESRQMQKLLEMLFPDGLDQPPRLRNPLQQSHTLNSLALTYDALGEPGRAANFYDRSIAIDENGIGVVSALSNLSDALRLSGSLREAERASLRALEINRESKRAIYEAVTLRWVGLLLAVRGIDDQADLCLLRALRAIRSYVLPQPQWEGYTTAVQAQHRIWRSDLTAASTLADTAHDLAQIPFRYEPGHIQAVRLQGTAALRLGDWSKSEERLHDALTHARNVNLIEEEIAALVALAELRRVQSDFKMARELLDDVWELAERGPYPLFHADALDVLAQIERDEGNREAAIEAATKAYRLAWCDGPPFAYHWGLEKAKKHLKELGAPEPEMPRFDESKFEPMPEVEINPRDEFYVDEEPGTKSNFD